MLWELKKKLRWQRCYDTCVTPLGCTLNELRLKKWAGSNIAGDVIICNVFKNRIGAF